jgi:phospholipid/cholesterol/gamma-HCH transport system substrate-binding protein
MRSVGVAGRLAAVGAVVAAIVIIAVLLFSSGGGYSVKADFINAGQLVKGDAVEIGGVNAGSVDNIKLTDSGQAEVTFTVDDQFKPLRQGTQATIRQASLSGIANRYIDLTMPPGDTSNSPSIPNGGKLDITHTTTAVDLDQLFDTLDPPTRKSIQDFFQNSAIQYRGKTAQQKAAFHYLNPALSTSSRLFNELDRDQPELVRFLQDSAGLVNDLASRRDDLAALIGNLNTTFNAISNEKAALGEALQRLPGFMRQANTTFVDLRSALDDVDPLVNASKPVALKLQPFLHQLRGVANDARPTVHDLSQIVFQPGPNNDLFDLEQSLPPLASIALDTKNRSINFGTGPKSVGNVRGSFPEGAQALRDSAPIFAQGRPYTVDLTGWFDDFSTTGDYDAAGNFSRIFSVFNAFDATGQIPGAIPLPQQASEFGKLARTKQYKRCPGGAEVVASDKSNVLSPQEQQALDCTESARASGTYGTGAP